MCTRYREFQVLDQEAEITATRTFGAEASEAVLADYVGWGKFSQLGVRVNVATVTGGADTYDVKLQTRVGNDWVDLITMTQLTAAGSESKWAIRTATVGWGDSIRVVSTVGAGATITLADITIIGAMA